ncbi:apolipoprotein D-like [Arapaima gigas]
MSSFKTATAGVMKVSSCCKTVSSKEYTGSIIGYRLQERKLPCVKAVIFETKDQQICSFWKAPWVKRKIREFEKTKRNKISMTFPSTESSTFGFSSLKSASVLYSSPGSFTVQSSSRESSKFSSATFHPSTL